MRGVELFQRARLAWRELAERIIFLSGGLRAEDEKFIAAAGLRLMDKPVVGDELRSAVRALVARFGRVTVLAAV